jgi:hypothetical protein
LGLKDEPQRIVWLREELARKQLEVQSSQRQYKELLEQKFEGNYASPSKQAAPAENLNILKLEHEMKQIKEMLTTFAKKQPGPQSLANMLQDLDEPVSKDDSKERAELKEL